MNTEDFCCTSDVTEKGDKYVVCTSCLLILDIKVGTLYVESNISEHFFQPLVSTEQGGQLSRHGSELRDHEELEYLLFFPIGIGELVLRSYFLHSGIISSLLSLPRNTRMQRQ